MSHNNVILTPSAAYTPEVAPLVAGPDISWANHCKVGDNQGNHGACSIFGLANWHECMTGNRISDSDCIRVYKEARMRLYGTLEGGLTVLQAFDAVIREGWFDRGMSITPSTSFTDLANAPLIACYQTTEGWSHPNEAGNIRQTDTENTGYHLVMLAADGLAERLGERIVWIENSWGIEWGYKGLGCMTEEYHRKYCKELWKIN